MFCKGAESRARDANDRLLLAGNGRGAEAPAFSGAQREYHTAAGVHGFEW